MASFFQNVLSDLVAGLLVTLITAALAFFYRQYRNNSHHKNWIQTEEQPVEITGESVSTLIDKFIHRQAQVLQQRSKQIDQSTAQRVIVEHRGMTASDNDTIWMWLVILLVAIFIADFIWVRFQLLILWITIVGIGLGIGSSVYYYAQLHAMKPPHKTEDLILFWGGLAIWLSSAVIAILAVHAPLYDVRPDILGIELVPLHAAQFIGMLLLFIAVIVLAVIQTFIGKVYQKALQHRPPYRCEIFVWEHKIFLLIIVGTFVIIAFMLGTGLFYLDTLDRVGSALNRLRLLFDIHS